MTNGTDNPALQAAFDEYQHTYELVRDSKYKADMTLRAIHDSVDSLISFILEDLGKQKKTKKFLFTNLFSFLVTVVPDPIALTAFARSLQSTRDPGTLYRRFVSHISSLETLHLVGPEVPAQDEIVIRHIVSKKSFRDKSFFQMK